MNMQEDDDVGEQRTLDSQNSLPYSLPSEDKFKAAMLFSAIGDALGWPTEFINPQSKKFAIDLPLRDYMKWRKQVGGRWWGYTDEIEPGSYSDDTQLTLAVARCIDDRGNFLPERFAYSELPLWLYYERGGGHSVKAAARAFLTPNREWYNTFYKSTDASYHSAGSNGAAMRNLPVALACLSEETSLVRNSFRNAIITHGHPRAIIGTILYSLALRYAASSDRAQLESMLSYLTSALKRSLETSLNDKQIIQWVEDYKKPPNERPYLFYAEFQKDLEETIIFLNKIPQYINGSPKEFYSLIGALDPATKGSGISTVVAAVYDFAKHSESPEEALLSAVNTIGSDTDTIAGFVGGLQGIHSGSKDIPTRLIEGLQDKEYMIRTSSEMHSIASGRISNRISKNERISRRQAYLNLLAWEIGLHEMFWDAIGIGGNIVHPTLGRGRIVDKKQTKLIREDYNAKLLCVNFESGQSCVFHSRIKKDGTLSESMAKEIDSALKAEKTV
jgi:ADP-ribosylglycohydrolase